MLFIILALIIYALPGIYVILRTAYLLELNYNIKITLKSAYIIFMWTILTIIAWPTYTPNKHYDYLKIFLRHFITKINR